MAVEDISDKNYPEFLTSERAVLVFGATNCHFCQEYYPILEELSERIPRIAFGKVILDTKPYKQSRNLKRTFGEVIRIGIPATLLLLDERPRASFNGLVERDELYYLIADILDRNIDYSEIDV